MNGEPTRDSNLQERTSQHGEARTSLRDKTGEGHRIRVFRGFDALPQFRHPVATIGSFDGVHLGHRALLDCLTAEARTRGGESIVLTFDPHPRITLGRSEGLHLLTSLDEKIGLLERIGVDNVVVIPFDTAFSTLSGREFVERYLLGRLGIEVLVAGYDHRFGHDRIACDEIEKLGLPVIRVDERQVGGTHVSSTTIRRLVEAGDYAEAERLLGHTLRYGIPAGSSGQEVEPASGESARKRPLKDNDKF